MSFHRCLILCVLLAFAGQMVASLNFQQKALIEWSEYDDASDESDDSEDSEEKLWSLEMFEVNQENKLRWALKPSSWNFILNLNHLTEHLSEMDNPPENR